MEKYLPFTDTYINAFESWFSEYDNWETFIQLNKLSRLLNRKNSITSKGFNEPKMMFKLDLSMKNLLDEKKNWKDALKKTTDLIYFRY